MICGFEIIDLVNLVLCVSILSAGCIAYIGSKDKAPFQTGVAFGLFGISHLISLMNIEQSMRMTVALLRISGYVIVLLVILKGWSRKSSK
jgi:hypothetical protein